jgi:hypothetical protein
MKLQTKIGISGAVLFSIFGSATYYLYISHNIIAPVVVCPFEVFTCPDGSGVSRVGPTCDFKKCPTVPTKQVNQETTTEQPPELSATTTTPPSTQSTSSESTNTKKKTVALPNTQTKKLPLFSLIATAVSEGLSAVSVQGIANAARQDVVTNPVFAQTSDTPLPPPSFTGQKLFVQNNTIVTASNTIVYTIPSSVVQQLSNTSFGSGWQTHTVNVVPVNNTPPVIDGIPVDGTPGKYYVSQNSFGSIENCEFSNRIYILDTTTNSTVLMYEENGNTLSRDDPRACNSEIYLLTNQGKELILKYHTIGTNTLCDSMWSEPEKTWSLDVTQLAFGMKKYAIDPNLTDIAEQEEATCRAALP